MVAAAFVGTVGIAALRRVSRTAVSHGLFPLASSRDTILKWQITEWSIESVERLSHAPQERTYRDDRRNRIWHCRRRLQSRGA